MSFALSRPDMRKLVDDARSGLKRAKVLASRADRDGHSASDALRIQLLVDAVRLQRESQETTLEVVEALVLAREP